MTETCDSTLYFDERDMGFSCVREKGHTGLHYDNGESDDVTHWENSKPILDEKGHFFMVTWTD